MAKGLIEDTTLISIANAIREKTGNTEKLLPKDMSIAIAGIEGNNQETFTVTDVRKLFTGNPLTLSLKDRIVTENIISLSNMTTGVSSEVDLSNFIINFKVDGNYYISDGAYFMYENPKLTHICQFNPSTVSNIKVSSLSHAFYNDHGLLDLPECPFVTVNLNAIDRSCMFYGCYSIKTIPYSWLTTQGEILDSSSHSVYTGGFYNCQGLLTLKLPVFVPEDEDSMNPILSNCFYNAFNYCSDLRQIVFDTKSDGTPYKWKMKKQTIDLTQYTGYAYSRSPVDDVNKQIKDAATYEQYKNDTDAWTSLPEYSWYNHNSAVETINSLPDTSEYLATAGGTNTIKFKGVAGSATDGGAINTLTDAEIAVATAKGWTVSLV